MSENEIAKIILDVAFKIHKKLGPGLFESVYEAIMEHELVQVHGLYVQRQAPICVIWESIKLDLGFRADMIVEHKVITELKSIEAIAPVHPKQVLTHLRLTELKLGILINFNEAFLKDGIRRIVNKL
jgi:GxxExxY protein